MDLIFQWTEKLSKVSHIRLLTSPIRFNVLPKAVNACRAVIRTGGNIIPAS